MCESTVLLKAENGLSSVMADAVKVVLSGNQCMCTDLLGRSVTLDHVTVSEIDLLRHRVILERA